MKIWIDDIRKAPDGYVHLKTLQEFKTFLTQWNGEIEILDLDHDLGENEPTGYDIIKWFYTLFPTRFPKKVLCHSSNPPGKENILKFVESVIRNREETNDL